MKTMKNAGINTDFELPQYKLRERDVKHERIRDSKELQNNYAFIEQLGRGCFGLVLKAVDKQTNKTWAFKIVNKQKAGSLAILALEREIKILKLVEHPNIIFLERVFESPKKMYLVFEVCDKELAKIFKEKEAFSEEETRVIIKYLSNAITYLHRHEIVHRDLKLENILIATNPNDANDSLYIKVTDFGLSIVKTGVGYENMLHDCCGTLTYMSPEIISKNYSQQCDVWSMGVIMYLLLSGRFPFISSDERELMHLIRTKEPSFSGFACCPEAVHLLTKMLAKNPALRITAAEIEHHPWILGIPMTHDSPENVLDMMRLWKSEMLTAVGDECDWVSFPRHSSSTSEKGQNSGTSTPSAYYDSMKKNLSNYSIELDSTNQNMFSSISFKYNSVKNNGQLRSDDDDFDYTENSELDLISSKNDSDPNNTKCELSEKITVGLRNEKKVSLQKGLPTEKSGKAGKKSPPIAFNKQAVGADRTIYARSATIPYSPVIPDRQRRAQPRQDRTSEIKTGIKNDIKSGKIKNTRKS